MKKLLCFAAVFLLIMSACENENLEEVKPEGSAKLKSYQSGTDDGYFWSLWTDDKSGWVDYNNGSGGNYSVSWNYTGNFTCGKGWTTGSKTRVIGYNVGTYSQNGGGGSIAYYGWTRNPLIEYYVNEMWGGHRPDGGTHIGTVYSDGATYDIYTNMRYQKPSIDGTQTFRQVYSTRRSESSVGASHKITFANHANAWARSGYGLGSDMSPSAIMLTESYGTSTGNANLTIWNAGSSTGDTGGGSSGGSALPIRIRARGVSGSERISLYVGGNNCGTWTLSTSMSDYRVTLYTSRGDIRVAYENDASGRDVQIDYVSVDGDWRQAEDQSYNTGVWQNGSCGGSYSEWLHCSGSIGFGNTP
ncbi:glycoside hydrolase family 11 protein [Plebeiibacterium sediminum]|uniref:Endo-1,4-beta-xylanase n=1 Tax=Plebeiibacterium sediminum TaxID=2992112 RepID=A0AAE3SGN2_9BACT|nr:glycoside hydrolase family 11 protein [Plebeiobacterium sediminum]MCW3788670.1 glycoside hydrolase family 11 protein [Plebeiobacterium sediminum]